MTNFYNASSDDCLTELQTSSAGLSMREANDRLQKNGPNSLEIKKPFRVGVILLRQGKSPLIWVLGAAALISFLLGEQVDGLVIVASIVINTAIGFYQEYKADRALEKLKGIIKSYALVLREGKKIKIESRELVIGDIMILRPGAYVPADGRVIQSYDLEINEANLTGEAQPIQKKVEALSGEIALADRFNSVFASTAIVSGSGLAVVTATGINTEIGKISELVSRVDDEETPLQKRLNRLSRNFAIAAVVVAALMFLLGLSQGRSPFEMFFVSVSLAVASIPEGLAVAVTVILVLGMKQILKKKALVRRLVAAETLGSTTVICTDKTGTLTEGRMTATKILLKDQTVNIADLNFEKISGQPELEMIMKISLLATKASAENPEQPVEKWKIIGTPTEAALLRLAGSFRFNQADLQTLEKKVFELPFKSETKFMASVHKSEEGLILYEKGAPEVLLAKTNFCLINGQLVPLDNKEKQKILETSEELNKQGLRLLAFGFRRLDLVTEKIDWSEADQNITFIGIVALEDPLRREVKDAISFARQAGIRTIVITGDHYLTATAIVKQIGGFNLDRPLSGVDLEKMSDNELVEAVSYVDIFARVSPEHKLRIVNALKKRGEVVAMTGDGLNDSPALKAADIGVCVGSGTDIAKETADLVLLEDNFKVITEAVYQGRVVFANIQRVVVFLIADVFSEIILIAGAIILGSPLPLLPVQILWINIINDGVVGFSAAFEKGNRQAVSRRKPVLAGASILGSSGRLIVFGLGIIRDSALLFLFIWLYYKGVDIDYLRSFFFALLCFKTIFSIFSLRDLDRPIWKINFFSNRYLLVSFLISAVLLIGAFYIPFLATVLNIKVLKGVDWLAIISLSLVNLILIEILKFFASRRQNKI